MSAEADCIHATCIAFRGRGALICGPSGAGKSDLALRCLGLGHPTQNAFRLIADDRVALARAGDELRASAPPTLRGLIEIRGVGIVEVEASANAPIALVIDLIEEGHIERLPDPWPMREFLGLSVPVMVLHPFEASAPNKIAAALMASSLPPVRPKA